MEDLNESINLLSTPTFVGTVDERVEALNLWTSLIGSIKKVTDLPSNENKVNILSYLITESTSGIERITNNSTIPVVYLPSKGPTEVSTIPNPSLNFEETKIKNAALMEQLFGNSTRMRELAGLDAIV